MKTVTLFFISFLIIRGLSAQPQVYALSGSVTDSATGKPIAAVSVFLNGTSKGTATHDDGTFLLTGIPAGGYQLIISAVGYATFQTEINTGNLPSNLKVTLHTRASELAAIIVKADIRNGWNKWGGTFWDYFIGTSDNASSCTIENKDVLRFHYNRKSKRLVVSAGEPLIIVNKALGYTVEYRFGTFSYDFSNGQLRFYGFVFFREMTPTYNGQQRVWESARQRAYLGSMTHFMRSLYKGRLKQEGFLVLHQLKKPNTEKERVKAIYNPAIAGTDIISADSLRHYRKVLREPDYFIHTINNYDTLLTVNADRTRSFSFIGIFTVGYGNVRFGIPTTTSTMELTDAVPLRIEENGSYTPLDVLLWKGAWARTETVANLLPNDYTPPPLP
jgi:CarboxypepD_reg-like domain